MEDKHLQAKNFYKRSLNALMECIINLDFLEALITGKKHCASLTKIEKSNTEINEMDYEDISKYDEYKKHIAAKKSVKKSVSGNKQNRKKKNKKAMVRFELDSDEDQKNEIVDL